ncbi:MAG: hypothetical protein ACYDAG_11305 [Chloroflexota bacterium]
MEAVVAAEAPDGLAAGTDAAALPDRAGGAEFAAAVEAPPPQADSRSSSVATNATERVFIALSSCETSSDVNLNYSVCKINCYVNIC